MNRARQRVGAGLAALGVAVLLVELLRYWLKGHAIHAWPVIIGCGFGFVGFYMINPIAAKDAGGFIEGFTVRVLATIRSGRRSTDVRAVVPASRAKTLTDRR